jgi:hypothetical protein
VAAWACCSLIAVTLVNGVTGVNFLPNLSLGVAAASQHGCDDANLGDHAGSANH